MMTTYKQYFKSLAAVLPVALTALAAASCSNDDAGSAPTGKTIAFTVTEDSQWQTRGAIAAQSRSLSLQAPGMAQPLYMTTTVADGMAQRTRTAAAEPSWPATRGVKVTTADQLTAFGVSAFLLKKTDVSVNTTPGYFYNLKATKSGTDDPYTVTQDYFWPAADECLHFYAYYPYDDQNVVISAADQVGPQTIAFTVDTDVSKQVDLMTAVAVDEATSTSVSLPTVTLPFRHELCAVSFRIAGQFPDWGGIVSVALKNVYGAGTVTPQQDADGTWSFTGQNKTTFTAVINKSGTANLDNGKLIDDALTFLMIPQELADDAVIELVYQDNRQNYTLTASLKEALKITDSENPNVGRAFLEAGKTVTFALSSTTLTTLKIGTITWPNAYSQPLAKNAYAAGDQAGLYVLADDNKTFAYQNIPVTYDGSTWQIDHSTAGVVYHRPGYHYYLYYPYTETPDTDYPLDYDTPVTDTSDEYIFSSLITGWGREVNNPQPGDADRRDQSQEANFTAADLHIAELTAEGGGNGYVSTVGATMKHAMGLAVFTLGTTNSVPQVIHRKLDSDATFTWDVSNGTTSVTASGDFNGKTYIPYKLNNTTYLYWVKPGETTSVSSSGADAWSETVNIALDNCHPYTEQSQRTSVETSETVSEAELSFTVGSATFKVIAVGGGNYNTSWSGYNDYEVMVNGTLTSFWLGQTEVTNGLWNAVMGSKPASQTNDGDTYPVAMVSWINIMGDGDSADGTASGCFMKKLNDAVATQLAAYGLSGRRFTLPSEAQWQWAAEGGLKTTGSYTYAGSNDLNAVAWNSGNSNSQTHPVAQKQANELKLYDMTGNVWEWCRDWYCSQSQIVTSQGTDYVRTTQADSSHRVPRGGSWSNGTDWCPVSRRDSGNPSGTGAYLGLRLLLQ